MDFRSIEFDEESGVLALKRIHKDNPFPTSAPSSKSCLQALERCCFDRELQFL